jgi:hypothetical protein
LIVPAAPVWYGWHEDVCQGSNPVLHNSLVTPDPDFSVKPTLTGDTVVLRPFTADDFPGLLQVLRDREVLGGGRRRSLASSSAQYSIRNFSAIVDGRSLRGRPRAAPAAGR